MTSHAALGVRSRTMRWTVALALALGAFLLLLGEGAARAADSIKIGFSTSLTGPLASSGKANLLA